MRRFFEICYALVERETAGRMAYRLSFLAELITAVIYFAGIFYVGKLVPKELLEGNDYFTVTVIGVGLYGFVSAIVSAPRNFIISEISMGTFETMMTLGPSVFMFVIASSLIKAVRALGRTFFILAAAMWFGVNIHYDRLFLLIPLFIIAGSAALGAGFIQAAFDLRIRTTGRIMALAGGAGAILTGVYFPVSLLPNFFQAISNLLPATHAISITRSIMLHGTLPWHSAIFLLILAILLFTIGYFMLRRTIKLMKHDGSFSYY